MARRPTADFISCRKNKPPIPVRFSLSASSSHLRIALKSYSHLTRNRTKSQPKPVLTTLQNDETSKTYLPRQYRGWMHSSVCRLCNPATQNAKQREHDAGLRFQGYYPKDRRAS